MKLLAKFNLILLVLFGVILASLSHFAHEFLMDNARQQVLQQAELMVESARATRDYTEQELDPLLEKTADMHTFVRQTIPFYAATVTFDRLKKSYPQYSYKEAALNPTNPRDRASDWEADIIQYFRNNPSKAEIVGERSTPAGPALYLAHPIAAPAGCLQCHGVADQAPLAITATYGTANGFGWNAGEIVGAQIVSVPMTVPINVAGVAYRRLQIYLIAAFLATLIAVDLALVFIVVRPVQQLANRADRISHGEMAGAELPARGRDEIADLTRSLNRMYVSLAKALKMLQE
ncbi:MAG: c-type heme family protein [Terriglobales bacterium]